MLEHIQAYVKHKTNTQNYTFKFYFKIMDGMFLIRHNTQKYNFEFYFKIIDILFFSEFL